MHGHGDDGALWKVLYGDAERKRHRAAQGDAGLAGKIARKDNAHGHPLRDVVQRHRKDQHGRTRKGARGTLRLVREGMQMGNQMIERQKKQDPEPKAHGRRQKGEIAIGGALFDRGD